MSSSEMISIQNYMILTIINQFGLFFGMHRCIENDI